MSHDGSARSVYWKLLVVRSVVAALIGAIVTFSPNHSPEFGLVVAGGLAVGLGACGIVFSRRAMPRIGRIVLASESIVVLVGVSALVAAALGAGLRALVVVLALFGVVLAVTNVMLSRVRAEGGPSASDYRVLAAVSALLVIGVTVGRDNSVVVVGILGAWAAVTAVYSLITAFTLKWESDRGTDQVVNL